VDDGSLRASEAEREQAVAALRKQLAAGRLTLEEFCERADAARAAQQTGQLAAIEAGGRPSAALNGSGENVELPEAASFATALFGHRIRSGRMRLRGRPTAVSVFGDLDLDLRAATVDGTEIAVNVVAVIANVDIYVPEGVRVAVRGMALMGHGKDWGRDAGHADAPVLRVHITGLGGTVDIWRVPAELRDSSYTDIIRELRLRSLPQPPAG
jgi:hypothetical protein